MDDRQTDDRRQTDRRTMTNSEREREFTFAKNLTDAFILVQKHLSYRIMPHTFYTDLTLLQPPLDSATPNSSQVYGHFWDWWVRII